MITINKQSTMSTAATLSLKHSNMCPACQQFRDNYLRAWLSHMMSRQEKQVDPYAASSHVNFRYLSTPEKLQHIKNLSQVIHAKDKVMADLRKKVDLVMKADSVTDQSTHNDLLAIHNEYTGSGNNLLKVAKLSKKSGIRCRHCFSSILDFLL